MKTHNFIISIVFITAIVCKGYAEESFDIYTLYEKNGLNISLDVEKGMHWSHKLQIIPLLYSIKTPPQIAVWIETMEGEYIRTLYVTEKTAKQNWRKAPGDKTPKESIRRDSALPYWAHKHGIVNSPGSNIMTKVNPLPDAITEATPKSSFVLHTVVEDPPEIFRVFAEINSSTDFNEYYPNNSHPGERGYSGGEWGSGQPAVVYTAVIENNNDEIYEMSLAGHSSPDGSDGLLYDDLSLLTTGKEIVSSIKIEVNQ